MEYNTLILDLKEPIALITLNRPKSLNALNSELYAELNKALDVIEKNDKIRALVITGEGKAFVAGADISEMSGMNYEQGRKFAIVGQDTFNRLSTFRIPVIAAINGFALGGGCEFAMGCDIRIANEFAKFGQPEVNLGLIPGYCGTQRLSRIVGLGNALNLLMTADIIDANEALRIGLVQKVVPADELLNEAVKLAMKIASKGKMAVQKVKEVTVKGLNMDFYDACLYEADEFGKLFDGSESQEGMSAFLEKRKSNWD